MRRFSIAALAMFSLPGISMPQCKLPPVPGSGTPDPTFDALAMQNGPGWTGGDGTYSLLLPDGTGLWIWSDSYLGTVDPSTRMRAGWLFNAHNALTIQTPGSSVMSTVGYPAISTSYFAPANAANWFWPGDALLVPLKHGKYEIKVMLLEWTGDFDFQGNSVATLSWPDLTIESIDPIPLPDLTIEWGAQLMKVGKYLYLYGIQDPGTWQKLPYVARMTLATQLTKPPVWEYWNATSKQWMPGQSNATPMAGVPAITNEYSVTQLKTADSTFYMMTGMETWSPPYPDWQNVVTYYACSPTGPWHGPKIVYVTPESGAAGCSVGTLYTYNPKAHPEFTDSTGVLVSYNVNANNSLDLVCANDYMPRFIRIPISGLSVAAK